MQNEERTDMTIQRYLDGEMTNQEMENFEKSMEKDVYLKNEVDEYKSIAEGIAYQGRAAAWKKIQELEKHAEAQEKTVVPLWKQWPFYATAASLALLVAVALFLFNSSPDPEELFAEYFEPYSAEGYGPTRSDTTLTAEEEAVITYIRHNYSSAIRQLELISEKENDVTYKLLLASSYLANEDTDKAINYLEKVVKVSANPNPAFKWYLGLAYLSHNDLDKAKSIFVEIASGNSMYRKTAKDLLNKLNS